MSVNTQPYLELSLSRCRVATRIQEFLNSLDDGRAVGRLLDEHFHPFDLAQHSLTLPTDAAPAVVTEALLFGFGVPRPDFDVPLELRLVAYGLKPLALLHGSEAELGGWVTWAGRRGFTALLSSYQWLPRHDQGKGGYSNLTTDHHPAEAGSGAWRSLLVSMDEDLAIVAWLSLHFSWDALLGKALGYPDCCAAAFGQRWPVAVQAHQGDLAPLTLAASGPGPYDWRVNIFARYFGATLIQHFPCRFECEESRSMAARLALGLGALEPEFLSAIQALMRAPVLYTEEQGIALLPGASVVAGFGVGSDGMQIAYDQSRLLCTVTDTALSEALNNGLAVSVDGGRASFQVGGQRFAGHLIQFDPASESTS